MKIRDTLFMALGGLSTHKSRSALTILGIVIGIASITLVMSLGQGAQDFILGEIQKFGPLNAFILPGRQPSGPSSIGSTLLNDSLKLHDIDALNNKNNVPDARLVIPIVFGQDSASFESQTYSVTILGSNEKIQKIFNLSIQDGDFFSNSDVLGKSNAVVIGVKVAEELFGVNSPVGQKIKIKGQILRVVGLLKPQGSGSFINFDKAIIAPYPAVQNNILGIKYFQRVIVEGSSTETMKNMIADISRTLRTSHNIDDPSKDDFSIQTQDTIAQMVKTVTSILTVLLACVAAISLVVGGVGIMNIMLVSVTERTKEIGLRKALGASSRNVLLQFLIEAILLTLGGGVVGVLGGIGLSWMIAYIVRIFWELNFPFVVSISGVLLGIGVSVSIGILFGIFPAWSASRKSPVETLRYE